MRVTSIAALTLGLGHPVFAQNLSTALSRYPEVSTFQGVISQVPGGISSLLPTGLSPNSSNGVTVLIPSNKAFSTFLSSSNLTNISSVPLDRLLNILFYHIMYAKLSSANFSSPDGLIVPTLLKDQKYNNRSAGTELINQYGAAATQGNVLYVSKDPINPVRFRVRQQTSGAALRGGMGQGASIDAVDAAWDLGYFQILDSVLIPPAACSNTIQAQGTLKSLDTALTNAGLWEALDHSPNVTCLAPTNNAFQAAGDPQLSLNSTELSSALLFHTLPMPLYSTYIPTSGLIMQSLAGVTVTVAKVNGDIYFNDAKVISPNVLTNNGLIHVLDKVMSPNGTAPAATATTTSAATTTTGTMTSIEAGTKTGSSTAGSTPQSSNAAVPVGVDNAVGGLIAFFVAAAVLF